MNNHFKSRALIVSCAVVALVAVSVAEIPRPPTATRRGTMRCGRLRGQGINTSAEGGIVIEYSADEMFVP